MDLLNKLGNKADEKSSDAKQTETIVGANSTSDNLSRGANMLDGAKNTEVKETKEVAAAKQEEVAATNAVETKQVKDPDSWTKDSALSEVTKLREENKAVRTKFQEQLAKLEEENQKKIAKIQEEAASAKEAQKKLEALEAEKEDKKRSIEDKLADREAKLARSEAEYKRQLEEKERELQSVRAKAAAHEAESEARKAVYRERVKEELAKIPENFRAYAEKMVKGVEDPHEAWLTLSEASRDGVFGEKKVVVNHSVPGAGDGARMDKAKLEAEAKEKKGKMTSRDKIKAGLTKIKSGESNTMFRSR